MAEMILEGKVHDGETVTITADQNGLIINGIAAKQAA
jgi:hypothetical protein